MAESRLSRLARRRLVIVAGALAVAAGLTGAAWALPPFTTAAKTSPGSGRQAELHSLSVGCHATYDRIALRLRFAKPGYDVRFVNKVRHDPSGKPVTLLGNARLLVVLRGTRAHTADGTTSFVAATITPLCPNLRQIKKAGDFEGQVSFGLGLQHTAGFRVFRLTSPTRVVIDVAH